MSRVGPDYVDVDTPLGEKDKDYWGRCCPPGQGCNMGRGYQLCHLTSVEMHTDIQAVRDVRFWWRRWRALHFWQIRLRREAWKEFRESRDRASDSPVRLPKMSKTMGLGPKPPISVTFQTSPEAQRLFHAQKPFPLPRVDQPSLFGHVFVDGRILCGADPGPGMVLLEPFGYIPSGVEVCAACIGESGGAWHHTSSQQSEEAS